MDYSKHSRLIEKNREVAPESYNEIRERAIVDKIRDGDPEHNVPKRSENEELALLRKAVKYLYDIVAQLHKGEVDNPEFIKYYNDIEAAKERASKELR